jgi:hypothetical protein
MSTAKPSTKHMLFVAFTREAKANGVSRAALKNYIVKNFGDIKNHVLAAALTKLQEAGLVGPGATTSRFRLTEEGKKARTVALKPKVAKKPAAKKTKAKAKKTTKAKGKKKAATKKKATKSKTKATKKKTTKTKAKATKGKKKTATKSKAKKTTAKK